MIPAITLYWREIKVREWNRIYRLSFFFFLFLYRFQLRELLLICSNLFFIFLLIHGLQLLWLLLIWNVFFKLLDVVWKELLHIWSGRQIIKVFKFFQIFLFSFDQGFFHYLLLMDFQLIYFESMEERLNIHFNLITRILN